MVIIITILTIVLFYGEKRMKQLIFLLFIITSVAHSQEYYYSSGKKIPFTQKPNKFVISISKDVAEDSIKEFLLRNELSTSEKSLKSEYLLVSSFHLDKNQIKNNLISKKLGQDIRNVYSCNGKTSEFSVTDDILIKLKNKSDLTAILLKYNLTNIESKWLGENVYLLSTNHGDEKTTVDISNQIYESGLVECVKIFV